MNEIKYIEQISSYLSGNMSAEEEMAFNNWLQSNETNQRLFEEMKKTWEIVDLEDEPFDIDLDEAWDKLDSNLTEVAKPSEKIEAIKTPQTTAKVRSISPMKTLLRIAAVALLVGGAAFWWMNQNGTNKNKSVAGMEDPKKSERLVFASNDAETKTFTLPDQSTVVLNANSTFSYNKNFSPRVIELNGEAFFDITKQAGQAFVIKSGEAMTTVLGTSFNVRAYPKEDKIEVAVITGKVAFQETSNKDSQVILTPKQKGVFDKTKKVVSASEFEFDNAIAWKTKQIQFAETPMSTVISDLERYFDVTIKVENQNIMNCIFTGAYNAKYNPEMIFEIIDFTFGSKTKTTGNKAYTVSGGKCK